jgi:hypothetical protein
MSGNYPDGLSQAGFDQYWDEKLDDRDPLDEPINFEPDDCFEIGHIVPGGIE